MSTAISLPATGEAPLALSAGPSHQTLAHLVHQLGDIPLERIRTQPPPGAATLPDVVDCKAKQGCLCELIDGVLVEKAMGFREGVIEMGIGTALSQYNLSHRLGVITSASSMYQIQSNLVRLPDVGYAFWGRFPGGKVTDDPAPRIAPDVAVEVLSPSNTRREMDRKRAEYFAAGTQLVGMVDVAERTVTAYTAPDRFTVFQATDTLRAENVLPDFALPLGSLFAQLDELTSDGAPRGDADDRPA
jgi:Uma2 family endonuclease